MKLTLTWNSTRDGPEERLRAQQYMLPSHVYRTFKENSATYSCFTTEYVCLLSSWDMS